MPSDPPFRTHKINPDVWAEFNRGVEDAFQEGRRTGQMFRPHPTVEEVARRLGVPMFVRRPRLAERGTGNV
jgi:hypothetical protein